MTQNKAIVMDDIKTQLHELNKTLIRLETNFQNHLQIDEETREEIKELRKELSPLINKVERHDVILKAGTWGIGVLFTAMVGVIVKLFKPF